MSDTNPEDAAEDAGGKRGERRDSLFLTATCRIEGGAPFATRVRNLSAGGMMIELETDVRCGDTIEADLRGIGGVVGRIAWAAVGRAGVAFAQDIDPALARRPVKAAKESTPVYLQPSGDARRPGFRIR